MRNPGAYFSSQDPQKGVGGGLASEELGAGENRPGSYGTLGAFGALGVSETGGRITSATASPLEMGGNGGKALGKGEPHQAYSKPFEKDLG